VTRSWGLGTIVLALLVAACGSSGTTPAESTDCVATPQEYAQAWNDRGVRCVAPGLYATLTSDEYLYPSTFWYAWANSSDNLAAYLELRSRYSEPGVPATGVELAFGLQAYVGFPVRNVPDQALSRSR